MENQDSNASSESLQSSTKIDIPLCEVVLEESENSIDNSSEIHGEMITYVVIPNSLNQEQILVDFCGEPDIESLPISFGVEDAQNRCPICGVTFKNCLLMHDHFSATHVDGDLTCQICKLKCANDLQLMRHYNKHKYSCSLCDASFGKYEDLFNHKKTHLPQTLPYACNICNEAYSSTKEISLHIREAHNQKRPMEKGEVKKSKRMAHDKIVQVVKKEKVK